MKNLGFTLIELLVSLALSAFLLLGISDFFLAANANIQREMLEKSVDDRAFLALQMLGKDISRSAHILDAGKVDNPATNNIQRWLNLSDWVTGADLQVWNLNPNSDWLVLNNPKPITNNFTKLAFINNPDFLETRLDGDMQSSVTGNSLECLFANKSGDWFGADFADQIRIAVSDYYSFTSPKDSNLFDAINPQDFEDFLFKNFALHFGYWKDKNSLRVYPNNWFETKHLVLDTSHSILPKNSGCIEIVNPDARLIHIAGTKNSTPKGELDISSKIEKLSANSYKFNDAGNVQYLEVDAIAKNSQPKISYFAKDANLALVLDKKTWRRANSNGALLPKYAPSDLAFSKISTRILGTLQTQENSRKLVQHLLEVEEFLPLLRVYNSADATSFYHFYEGSFADAYRQQIATNCPTSGWQKPQIVNFKNCKLNSEGVQIFNSICKKAAQINADLPLETPIFTAKIPQLEFSCAGGFSKKLTATNSVLTQDKQSDIKYYLAKTNTSTDAKTKAKSIFYYRLNAEDSQNASLFKRVDAVLGDLNYFATNNKIAKNSSLTGCDIKKIRASDFNDSTKQHFLPKFSQTLLLKPEDFIKSTSDKYPYKSSFNCLGDRNFHTSYATSSPSNRTNSEWRFRLSKQADILTSNLKFEISLWYVQKPTVIDRDNSKTLISSIAKCNANRECSFDNKSVRNQINGLHNLQIRFLNPFTNDWLDAQKMQTWLDANSQKWDKIKGVKIGLLVCTIEDFLPDNQTKEYRVLDRIIVDNSSYCKVASGSFYLNNPGLNLR